MPEVGLFKAMDTVVARYMRRILLLHAALLAVVLSVVVVASLALYEAGMRQAENSELDKLTLPANQTAGAIERYFSGVFDTMDLFGRDIPVDPEQAEAVLDDAENEAMTNLPPAPRAAVAAEALWNQLGGRVSNFLVLERASLRILQEFSNPPATESTSTGVTRSSAGRNSGPRRINYVPAGLAAENLVETARPWLENLEQPTLTPMVRLGEDEAYLLAVPAGRLPVILVGVVPARWVRDNFIASVYQQDTTTVLLTDAHGRVVAGGAAELTGERLPAIAGEQISQNITPLVASSDAARAATAILEEPVRIGSTEFNGAVALSRTVRVGPGEGQAWQLALLSDRERVLAPVRETARTASAWVVAVAFAVTAVLVSTAVQLVRGRGRLERLRAEMIDKELEEARQIQLNWLPGEEARAGERVELAAVNVPALHISGDFYNWFELEDGRWVIIIGDVTGHGMSAAFLMATAQLLVRTTMERITDPGRALEAVNNQLCTQAFNGQFVTMLVVIIDPETGHMELASAGHHAPLVCGSDGRFHPVPVDAQLVLGVMSGVTYPTAHGRLADCHSMLLYTDGVIELKNADGERFSVEKLIERLPPPAQGARALADQVMNVVNDFRGGAEVEDDLTLLAVHLAPIPAEPGEQREPEVAAVGA